MNGGILIRDKDFTDFSKEFQNALNKYKTWIDEYLDLLGNVCTDGIASGRTHNSLVLFKNELEKIKTVPEAIGDSLKTTVDCYLDDIYNAQRINGVNVLYDRSYPGYKDYSCDFFWNLEKMAEDADYDSGLENKILDGIEDLYYGVMKFFGCYDNSKEENIKKTQEALLQYNDVTKRQVRNIEKNIEDAENTCSMRLKKIQETINALRDYIYEFKERLIKYVQYENGTFNLNLDFDSKYSVLLKAYNSIISIDDVSDQEIDEFINSEESDEFLNEQVEIINNYLADLSQINIGDFDFWKIIIFQMFDVTETTITSGDCAKMIEKKALIDMLDELSENYVYDGSDEQKYIDDCSEFLKYYKKYGEKWYEYMNTHRDENGKLLLDGRTKEAKEFKEFLGSLGNAMDILEYGDQAINILSSLFIDYKRNLEFLDSFERNASLSLKMQECFAEIRKTYEHDLNQTLKETGRQILEDGVDALYSLSIGKMVGTVKKSIGIIGDVTGEGTKTAAQLELLDYGYDIVNSSQSAFIESMRKLKEASKDDENYIVLQNDFKNCFSMYKSSLTRLFEKMAASVDGPQKDYYYYCSSQTSSMKLSDFGNKTLMTYEEYLKDGYAS